MSEPTTFTKEKLRALFQSSKIESKEGDAFMRSRDSDELEDSSESKDTKEVFELPSEPDELVSSARFHQRVWILNPRAKNAPRGLCPPPFIQVSHQEASSSSSLSSAAKLVDPDTLSFRDYINLIHGGSRTSTTTTTATTTTTTTTTTSAAPTASIVQSTILDVLQDSAYETSAQGTTGPSKFMFSESMPTIGEPWLIFSKLRPLLHISGPNGGRYHPYARKLKNEAGKLKNY